MQNGEEAPPGGAAGIGLGSTCIERRAAQWLGPPLSASWACTQAQTCGPPWAAASPVARRCGIRLRAFRAWAWREGSAAAQHEDGRMPTAAHKSSSPGEVVAVRGRHQQAAAAAAWLTSAVDDANSSQLSGSTAAIAAAAAGIAAAAAAARGAAAAAAAAAQAALQPAGVRQAVARRKAQAAALHVGPRLVARQRQLADLRRGSGRGGDGRVMIESVAVNSRAQLCTPLKQPPTAAHEYKSRRARRASKRRAPGCTGAAAAAS